MPKTKQTTALARWAFTAWDVSDRAHFIGWLRSFAKAWVFQLEKAPTTGRLHFQGRVSLKKRQRRSTLPIYIKKGNIHWSAEVTENEQLSSFYCMKEETCVQGPWDDKTDEWYPPEYDLKVFLDWQQEAIDMLDSQNNRQVLIVRDNGGQGKSRFCKYLEKHQNGIVIPSTLDTADKIMGFICSYLIGKPARYRVREPRLLFILDVPRAMGKSGVDWHKFMTCLEMLKDGRAHDWRHKATTLKFIWPKIICFCNDLPPPALLTADRWQVVEPDNLTIEEIAAIIAEREDEQEQALQMMEDLDEEDPPEEDPGSQEEDYPDNLTLDVGDEGLE